MLAQRERCRQAWRFDAEQVDQPRDAVCLRRLDHEIRRRVVHRRTRARQSRADAGIARLQLTVLQGGVIAAHRLVEGRFARGVEAVVDAVAPAQVRPELALPTEVERHVGAQGAFTPGRVHEMAEGRFARQREVVADRVVQRWHQAGRHAVDPRCHLLRTQPRRVHHRVAQHARCFRAAHLDHQAVWRGPRGQHTALQSKRGTRTFRVAQVRQHQRVAVDDARRGRVQGADAGHLGLHVACLGGVKDAQVGHAVGRAERDVFVELGQLRVLHRHDQLADALVADAAFGAVGVHRGLARHAQPALERAGRIRDARMDHLRIARAGMRADGVLGLEDHHLAPGHGERSRDGQTHHAGADHDAVDPVHAAQSSLMSASRISAPHLACSARM
ncbi:hypothetical protein D9M72_265510 [compost metagenome]